MFRVSSGGADGAPSDETDAIGFLNGRPVSLLIPSAGGGGDGVAQADGVAGLAGADGRAGVALAGHDGSAGPAEHLVRLHVPRVCLQPDLRPLPPTLLPRIWMKVADFSARKPKGSYFIFENQNVKKPVHVPFCFADRVFSLFGYKLCWKSLSGTGCPQPSSSPI